MLRALARWVEAWQWSRRSFGACGALVWFVSEALERSTGSRCRLVRYLVVAQPVKDERLVAPGRATRLDVRRLTLYDPALEEFPRNWERYKMRFDQGAIAYGAFDGEIPVGFIWFVLGVYHEDEVYCSFHPSPEGEVAWDFDVYVAPPYRLTSAFARLWDAAYAHMRQEGIRWTMSRISAFNPNSVAAHRRLGAVECGMLNFLCVGSFQLEIGSVAPYLWISWGEWGKPQYRVSPIVSGRLLNAGQ